MSVGDTLAAVVWTHDPALLERTLEPLVLGPCRPDEVLVFDAAWTRTDETADVVAAFARRHPGTRPRLRSESPAEAAARALGSTRARWLLVLAAGDVVLPDALGRALGLASEHPSAGAVLARAATFDPAGALASPGRGIPGRTSAALEGPERFRELSLGGDPLEHAVPAAALLGREALAALGGVREALGPLTLPLAAWSLAAVHGAACLPEPLVDEQGPPSELDRLLANDPASLLAPLQFVDDLGLPREVARSLRESLERRILESSRAALARTGDTLGGAAKMLAPGSEAPLLDRALVRLLELAVALTPRAPAGAARPAGRSPGA